MILAECSVNCKYLRLILSFAGISQSFDRFPLAG